MALGITVRRIRAARTQNMNEIYTFKSIPGEVGEMEINNRAETTVLGANMTLISFTGHLWRSSVQQVHVNRREVPIATATTAYDDPETGETTILEFH